MKILFNEQPVISYYCNLEEHQEIMNEGYASQIENTEKKTVLVFQDVDDHIDGNGLSMLWLIKGQGRFYYDGEATEMKKGDVLVFDDNIEHGFESNELCMAMNVSLDREHSLKEIKELIKSINSAPKRLKP
jgi:hypothetical protein